MKEGGGDNHAQRESVINLFLNKSCYCCINQSFLWKLNADCDHHQNISLFTILSSTATLKIETLCQNLHHSRSSLKPSYFVDTKHRGTSYYCIVFFFWVGPLYLHFILEIGMYKWILLLLLLCK